MAVSCDDSTIYIYILAVSLSSLWVLGDTATPMIQDFQQLTMAAALEHPTYTPH